MAITESLVILAMNMVTKITVVFNRKMDSTYGLEFMHEIF